MSSVGEASVLDGTLDSPEFDVVPWAREELTERELSELLETRERLQGETLELDNELQGMVYYNYSNYAEGTRLVGGLKEHVAQMTTDLRHLETSLERNKRFLHDTNEATKPNQSQVQSLVAITTTLNGVQLLLELPARLRKSIEDNELDVGIRLWEKGRGVLKRHMDVPSLSVIRAQCEPIVDEIESRLWGSVSSHNADTVRQSIKSLRMLGKTNKRMEVELRARVMGEVAKDLDAHPDAPVLAHEGTSLSSALVMLLQCLKAADVDHKHITNTAVEMLAPRLGLLAARTCREAVLQGTNSALEDAASAVTEDIAALAIEVEELGEEHSEHFVKECLMNHVATAVCGDVFDSFTSGTAVQRDEARRRVAKEALARAKVMYYLSLEECHKDAGLPMCGIDLLPVAVGLLRRHLQLEEQLACRAVRESVVLCVQGEEKALSSAVLSHVSRVVQRINESPFLDSMIAGVVVSHVQHVTQSVLEVLRNTLVDLPAYTRLFANVAHIADSLPSIGVKEAAATAWRATCLETLKQLCTADDIPDDADLAGTDLDATHLSDSFARQDDSYVLEPLAMRMAPTSWTRGALVGRWSLGNVFNGKRPDGSQDAVKVMALPAGTDQGKLLSIVNEISTLSKLRHTCVAATYGCALENDMGELCIFTELVTGSTLGALVRRAPTPWAEEKAIQYIKQVSSGLAFLHSRGVVHRDVKGDNVMVAVQTGNVKIIDIALAHAQDLSDQKGTALWMAPEVITGSDCTSMSDVWSLGILVCEVLGCGKTPWEPFATTSEALQTIGAWSQPLPPCIPKKLSSKAKDFLVCCLRPSRMKRWTAHALERHAWLQSRVSKSADCLRAKGCAVALTENPLSPKQPCELKVYTVLSSSALTAQASHVLLLPRSE